MDKKLVKFTEENCRFSKIIFLYISTQLFAPVFPVLKEKFFLFTSIRATFWVEFSLGLSFSDFSLQRCMFERVL